jgi:hypothetical protein
LVACCEIFMNHWIKQEVGILLTTRGNNNFFYRQLRVVSHWNDRSFNVNIKIMFVRINAARLYLRKPKYVKNAWRCLLHDKTQHPRRPEFLIT